MKDLFLLFCLICFMDSQAQTDIIPADEERSENIFTLLNSSAKKLSEDEVQKMKEMYVNMITSDTYILFMEAIRKKSWTQKGTTFPRTSDREKLTKWMEANLDKTFFNTVEEGVDTILQAYELGKKVYTDNEELFTLMGRANSTQKEELTKIRLALGK
jgi:UDP-galactopyranose mutase